MLRLAQSSDLPVVEALYQRTILDLNSRGLFQWNEVYPNRDTYERAIANQTMYIYQENDQLLGAVILDENQAKEWETVDWQLTRGRILVIHALVVDPAMQGKGLGRSLLELCEQHALEHGYSRIRLDAFRENSPVLKFYERAGYTRAGEVFFPFKPEGCEWYVCYEKEL